MGFVCAQEGQVSMFLLCFEKKNKNTFRHHLDKAPLEQRIYGGIL
jgi:hypothetical protein